MAAARAWVRAAVLLAVSSLHGCGEWTPQTYCEEKVNAECKNFDDILEKKRGEEGAKPEDFTPSHPIFYAKCKIDEGKKTLISSCATNRNWIKIKHEGKEAEDGSDCEGTVSLAMNAPQNVIRGRRVLDCIEADFKEQGAKPWEYAPSEGDAAEKPKAKGEGDAGAVQYCDCSSKVEDSCGEGKQGGKVEDGVSADDADAWCKEQMEAGKSSGLSVFLCMCHKNGGDDCKHPPKGVSYAEAVEFCKELDGVEDFEADLFDGLGTCAGEGDQADAPLQLKATYRERKELFELKKDLKPEDKEGALKAAEEMCKAADAKFTAAEESELELPPRPRRPQQGVLAQGVLAQDTSRTEQDHGGVKVRLAASRQMEVLADGQSRRAP